MNRSVFMRFGMLVVLLFLLAAPAGAAEATPDPAARFVGQWAGPANSYNSTGSISPTNVVMTIKRSASNPQYLVVELTIDKNETMRLTRCQLINPGELRVHEEVMSDLRRLRVEGVLKSRRGARIEEGYIRFLAETPSGDYLPYFAVKLAAKRTPPAK